MHKFFGCLYGLVEFLVGIAFVGALMPVVFYVLFLRHRLTQRDALLEANKDNPDFLGPFYIGGILAHGLWLGWMFLWQMLALKYLPLGIFIPKVLQHVVL